MIISKKKGISYHKEHILPGNLFLLKMDYPQKYENEIMRAFSWLIHYGGVGARNRNGFGSIYASIEEPEMKFTNETFIYTALSKEYRLFTFKEKDTWHEAHSEIGSAYRIARLGIEKRHQYNRRKRISAPITINRNNVADLERHAKPYFLHVQKVDKNKYQGQILYMPYKYLSESCHYHSEKLNEYKKACEGMNKSLQDLTGGTK